jgi:hypothetical protein
MAAVLINHSFHIMLLSRKSKFMMPLAIYITRLKDYTECNTSAIKISISINHRFPK